MDKNNKKIIFEDEEYNVYDLNNENNNYEEEDNYYENIEYFENTINIIHNELINYIESKSLTLGEYLNKDKLNMLLSS